MFFPSLSVSNKELMYSHMDLFHAVRKAAAWADANTEISRSTPLVNIVDEFASRLFAELDYIKVRISGFLYTSTREVNR